MNKTLKHYLVAVQHPEVSGFEHREMLLIRDKLAVQKSALSPAERVKLAEADRLLLAQVDAFNKALSQVTDLKYEREQRQPPPEHWWWYLDVLTTLPELPRHPNKPEPALI